MGLVRVGPTGRLVRGDVLDVAVKPFERALRELDPLLYVNWNSTRLNGYGCWEIRRKSEYNSVVEVATIGGVTIKRLEAAEIDMVNHIMNCAFLNYDQVRKLKEIDTWQHGPDKHQAVQNWLNNMESDERKNAEVSRDSAVKARRYAAKHYKKELGALKEAYASGWNPAEIASYWDRVKTAD